MLFTVGGCSSYYWVWRTRPDFTFIRHAHNLVGGLSSNIHSHESGGEEEGDVREGRITAPSFLYLGEKWSNSVTIFYNTIFTPFSAEPVIGDPWSCDKLGYIVRLVLDGWNTAGGDKQDKNILKKDF